MNRRGFLQMMGGSLALSAGGIALLDGEVWRPGFRTIVLPPRGGWVAGTYGYSLYSGEHNNGALQIARGKDYPTMVAALRAASEVAGPDPLPVKYEDDDGEEYVWTPPKREFVVWVRPYDAVGPFGRRVIYNSAHEHA